VAFEVADLDALDERLRAAGVVYQGERIHGPHCRMSNILDSEGNALILHQLAPKTAP
jgi:predicted enzyme related to lactoylglutathione lyase